MDDTAAGTPEVTTPTTETVVTPLDFTEPMQAPAPEIMQPTASVQDITARLDEIDVMVGHSHAECRDTVRARTAEIRALLKV